MIYIELILVALVTIYIVDLSGFTESWRSGIQRMLHISSMRSLKPFDCSQCMTWWCCIIYSAVTGQFSLYTIAFSALLAFLSIPLGQVLIFIKEWLCAIINKLMP